MQKYLAPHIKGFSEIIREALYKRFSDVKISEQAADLVVFETNAPIGKVNHTPIFTDVFLVINSFTGLYGHDIYRQIIKMSLDRNLSNIKVGDSFKIVHTQDGQNTNVNPILMGKMEENVAKQLELKVNQKKPYWEFWIITRGDTTHFCLRLTYHPSYEKALEPGVIRPDLAGLLCYISDPQKSDVFLDPSCRNGAIPVARADVGKFSRIYGVDADEDAIAKLKESFEMDRVEFITGDVTEKLPFASQSINKIVTDPFWNDSEMLEKDETKFINDILGELCRVLKKDGILVMLYTGEFDFAESFKSHGLKILKTFDVIISRESAKILKLGKI